MRDLRADMKNSPGDSESTSHQTLSGSDEE